MLSTLTLTMEVICFSKMDCFWTTWCHNPRERTLHSHCCEKLKCSTRGTCLPTFKVSLLAVNYMFMTAEISCGSSVRQFSLSSVIVMIVPCQWKNNVSAWVLLIDHFSYLAFVYWQERLMLCGSSASLELCQNGWQLVTVITMRGTALVNCHLAKVAKAYSWAHLIHKCPRMDA
jgi:hypothetical protein